jgi:hypothetical protein
MHPIILNSYFIIELVRKDRNYASQREAIDERLVELVVWSERFIQKAKKRKIVG